MTTPTNPPTGVSEQRKFIEAKIRFILDKYFIGNPLEPDDADIDMAITELYLLKLQALHQLVLDTVMEAIGEDEKIDGSSLANQIALSCNELRQELRTNLTAALKEVFHG